MITRYDFFYDAQFRRFLIQVVRAFSGFQYMTGRRGEVAPRLKIVPCITANRDRQVAAIQQNMSQNVVNTVPIISVDMSNVQFDAEQFRNPGHISTSHVHERKKDINGQYTNELGNSITIQRLMPRPFKLTFQIDIWTSNLEQKHQLMEQILTMVCPTFEIQNSDNALDWAALSEAHVTDVNWTTKSFPMGAESEIDISTITMEVPMLLNPPAKVLRHSVIEEIITNINSGTINDNGDILPGGVLAREITTPSDHYIKVENGEIFLLGPSASELDPDGNQYKWNQLFIDMRKTFIPATSQLRLMTDIENSDFMIVGTLQQGDSENSLDFQMDIDTLPQNTLSSIDAVINPLRTFPGEDIPAPVNGQRYLISEDLPENNLAWGMTGGLKHSIIEYVNGAWKITFNPRDNETSKHYLLNKSSQKQLYWNGEAWSFAIDGLYAPGYWRLY